MSDARDEEVTDEVVCHGCAHSETPLRREPCRTCFGDPARPGFRKNAVPPVETVVSRRLCKDCVHSEVSLQLEPCRSCYGNDDKCKFVARTPAVTPSESDEVERPAHYTRGKVECIDAIEAAVTGLEGVEAVLTGQVVKYLWRWRHKGRPLEDLKKARWYLDRLLARAGGGSGSASTPAK